MSGDEVARRTMLMSPEQAAHIAEFLQVITNLVAAAAYDTMRARRVIELETGHIVRDQSRGVYGYAR